MVLNVAGRSGLLEAPSDAGNAALPSLCRFVLGVSWGGQPAANGWQFIDEAGRRPKESPVRICVLQVWQKRMLGVAQRIPLSMAGVARRTNRPSPTMHAATAIRRAESNSNEIPKRSKWPFSAL